MTQGFHEISTLLRKCEFIRQQMFSFLKDRKVDYYPNDFNNKNSLAPIIGTICDQQISADVAWKIPYHMNEWLKSEGKEFRASTICEIGRDRVREWLRKFMEGKWPKRMKEEKRQQWLNDISNYIIETCKKIASEYGDEPDNIFTVNNGNISIPMIYFLLRQFLGIGPKKASMIARDFGRGSSWLKSINERLKERGVTVEVKVEQIYFTEMPIDVHVRRVFGRIGFARYSTPQDFQNLVRLIYPENPGLVDDFIWELGRKICKNYSPKCPKCPLAEICDYYKQQF